jgi:tetrahydromethanopterin:alpha-L-glutamate ligase
MKAIALVGDQPDWHARALAAAFAKRGIAAVTCSLRDCAFRLGEGGTGVEIPGFGGALPDAVLVRGIAAGSFEQVTLRLGLLHALAALGVPVVNDARAIERCVDKSMTSFLLHRAGLPTPATLVSESEVEAERWRRERGGAQVVKPLFGSQGRDLMRLDPEDALPARERYGGVRYLQRFVGRGNDWRDFRVMVIGGEPVAAMIRRGRSWITNVGRGARCEPAQMSEPLGRLSLAAAGAVGADYAGVDLIGDENGALQLLEVNSMPAWKGLQSVTHCDIAGRLASHVLARLG